MRELLLIGRITGLRVFRVPEFGTRASFTLKCLGQCPVSCCVADDVARELVTRYCEGEMVAVSGVYEARPSTASPNTPWTGRFRVFDLSIVRPASIAA